MMNQNKFIKYNQINIMKFDKYINCFNLFNLYIFQIQKSQLLNIKYSDKFYFYFLNLNYDSILYNDSFKMIGDELIKLYSKKKDILKIFKFELLKYNNLLFIEKIEYINYEYLDNLKLINLKIESSIINDIIIIKFNKNTNNLELLYNKHPLLEYKYLTDFIIFYLEKITYFKKINIQISFDLINELNNHNSIIGILNINNLSIISIVKEISNDKNKLIFDTFVLENYIYKNLIKYITNY